MNPNEPQSPKAPTPTPTPTPAPTPPPPPPSPSDWQTPPVADAEQSGVPAGAPAPFAGANGAPAKRKAPVVLIVAGIVIALLAAAAVYVTMFTDDKKKESPSTTTTSKAIDLATVNAVSLIAPTDMTEYAEPTQSIPTYSTYISKESSCSLEFGIVPRSYTQLEGDTLEKVAAFNVKTLRDGGATVEDPIAGADLIVKDAADSSVTYKIPTLSFAISTDQGKVLSHYSAAVTKNGDRVIVSRACADKTNKVPASALKPYDQKSAQITVSVQ